MSSGLNPGDLVEILAAQDVSPVFQGQVVRLVKISPFCKPPSSLNVCPCWEVEEISEVIFSHQVLRKLPGIEGLIQHFQKDLIDG
jgi:hypothetical protein